MSGHREPMASINRELGIEDIKKILPHRYPFLLVDRVLEIGEQHIVGIKNVSANEPFFQGHFPEKTVMPGVLMVEALAQVGGILILVKQSKEGKLAYLASINYARFRKMVVPGDQIKLRVDILKTKSRVAVLRGIATVGKDEVCETEYMVSFTD